MPDKFAQSSFPIQRTYMMGNNKSTLDITENNYVEPSLDDRLSQAVSDTALNKKMSSADLKKKKYSESNRSIGSIDGKTKLSLSNNQRQILKYCINNSKSDLGERIFRRVGDKNIVFRDYFEGLSRADRSELCDDLRNFIIKAVELTTDSYSLEEICRGFGEKYAHLDFKPDFVQIANSMTTECVFLDLATHPTTETVEAWSQLTSILFGLIRDGYYSEMRNLRRISSTITGSTKESEERDGTSDSQKKISSEVAQQFLTPRSPY